MKEDKKKLAVKAQSLRELSGAEARRAVGGTGPPLQTSTKGCSTQGPPTRR